VAVIWDEHHVIEPREWSLTPDTLIASSGISISRLPYELHPDVLGVARDSGARNHLRAVGDGATRHSAATTASGGQPAHALAALTVLGQGRRA